MYLEFKKKERKTDEMHAMILDTSFIIHCE